MQNMAHLSRKGARTISRGAPGRRECARLTRPAPWLAELEQGSDRGPVPRTFWAHWGAGETGDAHEITPSRRASRPHRLRSLGVPADPVL
jgi:hypothetical protein